MKDSKNNYFTPFITIGLIALPLVIWYATTNSVMEKLLILFIMATFVIPLTFGLLNICLNMLLKPVKPSNNSKPTKGDLSRTKKGGVKTNPSKYYFTVRNTVVTYLQNGVITRDDILYFKSCLDSRLKGHVNIYNHSFKFKNDANEIYIKLKSSVLKDEDYKYLMNVLTEIANNKQKEA